MSLNDHQNYWPTGPAESSRVREFAEYQWRKLKEESARDKASFMLSLKEITDIIIGHRQSRTSVAPRKGMDEEKSSYSLPLNQELRIASTQSLSSMRKLREQTSSSDLSQLHGSKKSIYPNNSSSFNFSSLDNDSSFVPSSSAAKHFPPAHSSVAYQEGNSRDLNTGVRHDYNPNLPHHYRTIPVRNIYAKSTNSGTAQEHLNSINDNEVSGRSLQKVDSSKQSNYTEARPNSFNASNQQKSEQGRTLVQGSVPAVVPLLAPTQNSNEPQVVSKSGMQLHENNYERVDDQYTHQNKVDDEEEDEEEDDGDEGENEDEGDEGENEDEGDEGDEEGGDENGDEVGEGKVEETHEDAGSIASDHLHDQSTVSLPAKKSLSAIPSLPPARSPSSPPRTESSHAQAAHESSAAVASSSERNSTRNSQNVDTTNEAGSVSARYSSRKQDGGASLPESQSPTRPIPVVQSGNTSLMSEQERRLQQWEEQLREREKQLMEFKNSLSRPLGAHMPARPSPPTQEAQPPSYEQDRFERENSELRHSFDRFRQPDIHIHNHLSPTLPVPSVPNPASVSAPSQAGRVGQDYATSAHRSDPYRGLNRFPYDRKVDYASTAPSISPPALPSFPYEYKVMDRKLRDSHNGEDRCIVGGGADKTQPTAQQLEGAPANMRELEVRIFRDFPMPRSAFPSSSPYSPPQSPALAPLPISTGINNTTRNADSSRLKQNEQSSGTRIDPSEEVDLSALSLERIWELTRR